MEDNFDPWAENPEYTKEVTVTIKITTGMLCNGKHWAEANIDGVSRFANGNVRISTIGSAMGRTLEAYQKRLTRCKDCKQEAPHVETTPDDPPVAP